jgi:hypothetical protein
VLVLIDADADSYIVSRPLDDTEAFAKDLVSRQVFVAWFDRRAGCC